MDNLNEDLNNLKIKTNLVNIVDSDFRNNENQNINLSHSLFAKTETSSNNLADKKGKITEIHTINKELVEYRTMEVRHGIK
jgi:hypothetical protein